VRGGDGGRDDGERGLAQWPSHFGLTGRALDQFAHVASTPLILGAAEE
jgi:hypothetical protein